MAVIADRRETEDDPEKVECVPVWLHFSRLCWDMHMHNAE